MLKLEIKCVFCKLPNIVECDEAGFDRYKNGEPIQTALPELSADERELIHSGICPKCWDNMFPDHGEEGLADL